MFISTLARRYVRGDVGVWCCHLMWYLVKCIFNCWQVVTGSQNFCWPILSCCFFSSLPKEEVSDFGFMASFNLFLLKFVKNKVGGKKEILIRALDKYKILLSI